MTHAATNIDRTRSIVKRTENTEYISKLKTSIISYKEVSHTQTRFLHSRDLSLMIESWLDIVRSRI